LKHETRDFVRLGEDFYIGFLYGDVADESELLRSARAVWLEVKSDNVEEVSRRILDSGLVRKLEVPDPHLYFQAPGGQCLRLIGIDEDPSFRDGMCLVLWKRREKARARATMGAEDGEHYGTRSVGLRKESFSR
jgi:hypothetical protein